MREEDARRIYSGSLSGFDLLFERNRVAVLRINAERLFAMRQRQRASASRQIQPGQRDVSLDQARVVGNGGLESADRALRLIASLKNNRAQKMGLGVGRINCEHALRLIQSFSVIAR